MLACRPMLCFAVAVMLGAVAARRFPAAHGHCLWGWLAFGGLLLWFLLRKKRVDSPPPALPDGYAEFILARPGFIASRGLNLFILIVCLGLFLLSFPRHERWKEGLASSRLPERQWFDAHLIALEPCREHAAESGAWRSAALLATADGKSAGMVPLRLSGPGGPDFRRGDVIQCRVRAQTNSVKPHPGAFDAALWLEKDGLAASLSIVKPYGDRTEARPRYIVVANDDVSYFLRLRRWIDAVRFAAVTRTLEYGGESGGMLAAMLFGYRRNLDADMRDSFRRVGIGHVLAISGLHVGLVVGLLWWISGWFNRSARERAVACLVLALLYLGLSGGQVAASRATLMAVIHLGGIAWGRKGDMLNSLGAAAFILVLLNPSAPFDVSFQLSFTAVVFIYMGLHRQRGGRLRVVTGGHELLRRRIANETVSLIRLSVATWFGLFPIIAAVFNQVNLIGLPINIVVIPLMSLVLGCGLLLPVLGWIPGAAWILTLPSRLLVWTAALADAVPLSSFPAHAPALGWVLLFYFCVFLLLLRGMIASPAMRKKWSVATIAAVMLSFAGIVASMGSSPPPASGRIALLPGRGVGTIVAESPEGGIVVLGNVARGGLNEAAWLHFARRDGGVVVVTTNGAETDDMAALAWHYPLSHVAVLPETDRDAIKDNDWRPVEGAPGVEIAVSRDAGGRIVWVAARTGGRMVCVASGIAGRQLSWRIEHESPGFDADLFAVGFRGVRGGTLSSPVPKGLVGVMGGYSGELPARWFSRRLYGVLVVGRGIAGYDGERWKDL